MTDSSKKTRETTRLKAIAINRLSGIKILVDIDPQSGRDSTQILPSLAIIVVSMHDKKYLSWYLTGIM